MKLCIMNCYLTSGESTEAMHKHLTDIKLSGKHSDNLQLSVVKVGHYVPSADSCLSLDSLHVLNMDVKE